MQLSSSTLLQGGKYRIEKVLGQGGFGITYLAVQVGLEREVAIKEFFMKEHCERDATTSHVTIPTSNNRDLVARFRQKFIKEAQTIARLNHPHIIRIYDIFEENGTAYYVMEYHNNGSLSELVKQHGSLSEAEALRYIREVADALGYIHEHQMNHLDVKPGNVLLDEKGRSVLIDFGLSKRYDESGQQTSTTPVGISHGYAPMEQYKQGGVGTFSPATDIYSLGATLYKLLTGQTPPDASDVYDDGLPSLPSNISPSIAVAVEQAMQPRRKDRPQSVAAFVSLLDKEPVVLDNEKDDEDTVLKISPKPVPKPTPKPKSTPTPKPRPKSKNSSIGKSPQIWFLRVVYYLLYGLMLCWNVLLLVGTIVEYYEIRDNLLLISLFVYSIIVTFLLLYIRKSLKKVIHWIGIGCIIGTLTNIQMSGINMIVFTLISLLLYGLLYWVIVKREKVEGVNR